MKLKSFYGVMAVALMLGLAGCGGGSSGGSDNTQTDTTQPTVQVNPVGGSTVLPDSTITLTFSETMDQDTVTLSGSLRDEAGQDSWSDDTTLVITPATIWTERADLTLTINGEDIAGNAMTEVNVEYHVSDVTAPSVVSLTPDDIVLDKEAAIVVHFSESMDSGSLVLGGALAGESVAGVWSGTNVENDTVTISPATRWKSGQKRVITVNATDVAGNALSELTGTFVVPMVFENFQPAEVVVGQANFTSQSTTVNEATIRYSYGSVAVSDNGQLFIGDPGNNRVLGYYSVPATNGAPANFVLGQEDFESRVRRTSQGGMSGPQQVSIDGNTVAIAEADNHRILIYNDVPQDGNALPDVVVGQEDFDSSERACGATNLRYPKTAFLVEGKLIVADTANHRVLIWNGIPAANGATPDIVLGQNALDTCERNDADQDGITDAASARTLDGPGGVWSDGTRLAVTDIENNRVLLWNTFPTDNFQPADIVLGQENFTDNVFYDPGAKTVLPYTGVWSNGVQLFISDSYYHRVFIWNSWPKENFASADVVLGQSDFTHNTPNDADQDGSEDPSPSQNTLSIPAGIFGYEDLLFISEQANNRILIFRSR